MKIIKVTTSAHGDRFFGVVSTTPVADITGSFVHVVIYERAQGGFVCALTLDGFTYLGLGDKARAAAIAAGTQFQEWKAQLGHTGRTAAAISADTRSGLDTFDAASFATKENIE
jgi:hypothetical protein